jgi:hypothetical protein
VRRVLAVAAITLLAMPVWAGKPESVSPSAAYVSALRVADAFLQAWATGDADAGFSLVSQRLRADTAEAEIRQYLEGLSNPHHMCFEVGAGTEVDSTRLAFPVVFYDYYLGEPGAYRHAGSLEVVREPGGWRVDALPPAGH